MSTSNIRQSTISNLIIRLQRLQDKYRDLYCQGRNPTMIDRWSEPESEEEIKLEVDQIYPDEDFKDDLVVFIDL